MHSGLAEVKKLAREKEVLSEANAALRARVSRPETALVVGEGEAALLGKRRCERCGRK